MNYKKMDAEKAAKALLNALKGDASELKRHLNHDISPIVWTKISDSEVQVSGGKYAGTYTDAAFEKLQIRIEEDRGRKPAMIHIQKFIPDETQN